MVKNVIFDIGKVLIAFDYEDYVYNAFDKSAADAVIAATWHNRDWNELDRGVMDFEDVVKLFASKSPEHEKEIGLIMHSLEKIPHMYDYSIPWVKELRGSGYNVYYLSNYFEYLLEKCPEALEFTNYMNGGIFSCNEKVIKPDHEIFKRLCAKYGLDKSECVFIDDSPRNIRGSESFGIRAFLFEGYEKSYPEIMGYLDKNGIKG